jgi:hypothetical protein
VLYFYLYFAEFRKVVASLLVLKVVRALIVSAFRLLLLTAFLYWEVASVYLSFIVYRAVDYCAGSLYNSAIE